MTVLEDSLKPKLCPTLCDPIDGSPPGSPIPGIFQARVVEWGAIAPPLAAVLAGRRQGLRCGKMSGSRAEAEQKGCVAPSGLADETPASSAELFLVFACWLRASAPVESGSIRWNLLR